MKEICELRKVGWAPCFVDVNGRNSGGVDPKERGVKEVHYEWVKHNEWQLEFVAEWVMDSEWEQYNDDEMWKWEALWVVWDMVAVMVTAELEWDERERKRHCPLCNCESRGVNENKVILEMVMVVVVKEWGKMTGCGIGFQTGWEKMLWY